MADDDFDPAKGKRGKREGMDRGDEHADEHWKQCWDECLFVIAQEQPYLNTDPVKRMMRERHPNVTTHDDRAIGQRMKDAAKALWIEKTYDTAPSTWAPCHSREKRTWRSLIYREPERYPKRRRPKPIDPRQFDLFNKKAAE
jgi:hypothetical protein